MNKNKGIVWRCCLTLSIAGLLFCVPLLFPGIRDICIDLAERFVFHRDLETRHVVAAREALAFFGFLGVCFILFCDFWALTGPGRSILEKTGFIDVHEDEILRAIKSLAKKAADRGFELFAAVSGLFVLMTAVSRAANTGMTRDEATMCFDLVFPGILEALMRSQYLNNHILDAFLIRMTLLITHTRFNEFFIRLPSLVFYGIYIFFAYRTAKEKKHPCLVFILFIANYYLNEFSGLARGYGMAAACMAAALCVFDKWKDDVANKHLFRCCMIWCSLGVLANGIALYTVFCILMVIMVKYRKNLIRLSNLPYFLVFLFVALYLVFVSRPTMPGKPIAVTRSFFDSIVTAVFSSFSLSREMLPFYPVIVFVAAEGLDCMKPGKITRFLCVLAGSLLCFQFIIQIDVTGSRDWREDYRRRSEILHFLAAQEPGAEASGTAQEKLNSYIGANPSSVGMFYLQKLTRILDEETGLPE